jgi:hypothetical protein
MAAVVSPVAAPAPAAVPRKLRVGIVADSRWQPRWVRQAFERVAASGFAEIVQLVVRDGARKPLLDRLGRWAFGSDACTPEAITNIRIQPGEAKDLDVIFALGGVDDSGLDGIARCGVWRFCADGVREVLAGEPVSMSGITARLRAGEVPRLAYQSWSRTFPFSVARNREPLLRKTAEFAYRALQELHRSGMEWLEQCPPFEAREMKNGNVLRFCTNVFKRGIEKATTVDQWFLAWKFGASRFGSFPEVASDLAGFTRLMPPKDRYWADPFPLEKNGRYFVFFEELPFAAGKAHISMIEVKPDGSASQPQRVLEREYHLSYPFLVEHEGALYMIPESARNNTVEAWRCVDFPLRWKRERVLLAGVRCVDATFHRGEDRWWIFANLASGGTRVFDDELHLFHAAELLGDWQPHPRNPVKSDVRGARPAGRLYWRNGALHRPAQVCTPRYGAGLALNRVLRLTPRDYAERQAALVLPDAAAGLLGLHTVNRAGPLTVVDAFARRGRF